MIRRCVQAALALSPLASAVACGDDTETPIRPALDAGPACATCSADGGADGSVCEEALTIERWDHKAGDLEYPDSPPASGWHNDCWASWGAHDEPVRPENWVHNLEHGGVVFLYDCPGGCDGERARLVDLAGSRSRTLVSPYAGLGGRFAAVAWGHRLVAPCLDEAAFIAFYDAHFNRGREDVAAGPPERLLRTPIAARHRAGPQR